MGRHAAPLHALERAAGGAGRRADFEDLLLGKAAAVREHLRGLGVAAATATAAGCEHDQHHHGRKGEQPTGSIAHELLALLGCAGLALTFLPLAPKLLLLLPAVRHEGEI